MGKIKRTSTSFTRPADTTAYAANDVVGPASTAVLEFANALAYAKGGGLLRGALLNKSTNTVSNATFRLFLYNDEPTAIADNAAWTNLYADRAKALGFIDFDTAISGGSGAMAVGSSGDQPLPVVGANGSGRSLYGVLVALAAYAPGSGETFDISLFVESGS